MVHDLFYLLKSDMEVGIMHEFDDWGTFANVFSEFTGGHTPVIQELEITSTEYSVDQQGNELVQSYLDWLVTHADENGSIQIKTVEELNHQLNVDFANGVAEAWDVRFETMEFYFGVDSFDMLSDEFDQVYDFLIDSMVEFSLSNTDFSDLYFDGYLG
jgi:hypothetical protein